MSDLVDLEHWRSFVRVDPVGPEGFKPRGQGRAALLSYVGNNHTSGRRVIGAELTRHQAENLCAAIMACFEEPDPDEPYWQKSFTVTPPPEGLEGGLAETAVVIQAKHGGPVPMTREEAEEFMDEIVEAVDADGWRKIAAQGRKPEDPVEVPDGDDGQRHCCNCREELSPLASCLIYRGVVLCASCVRWLQPPAPGDTIEDEIDDAINRETWNRLMAFRYREDADDPR